MSKHSLVLMVKRGSNILIPNGNTILKSGDLVFVYTKKNIQDSIEIDI
jgi:voltage-gated potassium channel